MATDVTQDESLLCYVLLNNTFKKPQTFVGGEEGDVLLFLCLFMVEVPRSAVQL